MHLTELTSATSMTTPVTPVSTDWSKSFNTSILSTVLDSKGHEMDLQTLVQSPEYECILAAARLFAAQQNVSPEEATERLIRAFRNIDLAWNTILLKKGAESLLGI